MSPNASDDLNLAKNTLFEEGLSLVVAKNGKLLFKSRSRGVRDLLAMINDIGHLAEGASLADSIVGRAAALLCVYSKIIAVYGVNMSEGAALVLKANGVHYKYGMLIPRVLNREKNDICPFDKAVSGIEDPSVALEKLKSVKLG